MRKLFFAIIALCFIACNNKESVDLIIHNAHIYTVDTSFATAEAMVIKDGKILETGSTAFILDHYEAKEKIDAEKKAVYPGFIDAHAHFVGYGHSLFVADLYDTKSFAEVLERLKAFAAAHPDEQWILEAGTKTNGRAKLIQPMNNSINYFRINLFTSQGLTGMQPSAIKKHLIWPM